MLKKSASPVLMALLLSLLLLVAAGAQVDPRSFYDNLQQRLIADGFNAERIRQIYQGEAVAFEARGVTAYFQHNEATLDYDRLSTESYIALGREYMAREARHLQQAEQRYGVNARVITAIILVETKFGAFVGTRSILNTLSTMACLTEKQPREYLWGQLPVERRFTRAEYDRKADQKAQWAYNELKAFLTYTAMHAIDATSVLGSYAGALGLAQFMPSNILAFGQDGDGDGRIDLFDDADAIYSIANYLSSYGWKPGCTQEQAYKAVWHYNHSKYYVNAILKIADLLGRPAPQLVPGAQPGSESPKAAEPQPAAVGQEAAQSRPQGAAPAAARPPITMDQPSAAAQPQAGQQVPAVGDPPAGARKLAGDKTKGESQP